MRSLTIVSVLFAAGTLATPVIDRRVLVTDEVVVTVTDYVTEGAVPAKVTVAPVAAALQVAPKANVAGYPISHAHHHHHYQPAKSQALVPAPEPTSSSTPYVAPPAPKPTTSTTPYVAPPAPEPTTTSKAAVPAPQPTTKAAPSPKTTITPSPVQSSPAASNNLPTTAVPKLDSASEIYKGLVVQHHNLHRQNHSVSDLAWNETLAGYAETVAKSCVWAHDRTPGGGGYGQNIAAGIEPGKIPSVVSNMWYNGEEPLYPTPYGVDSPDMSNFEAWGHYSQVVWADSETVGCYTSTCFPAGGDPQGCKSDGSSYLSGLSCGDGGPGETVGVPAYFTVCNYYPAGNYNDDYSKVKQPGSMGTVQMSGDTVTGL